MNSNNEKKIFSKFRKYLTEDSVLKDEIEEAVLLVKQFLDFTKNKNGDLVRLFAKEFNKPEVDMNKMLHRLWIFLVFIKRDKEAAEIFKMLDGYNIPDVFKSLLKDNGCPEEVLEYAFSDKKPEVFAKEDEKSAYIIGIHKKLSEKANAKVYHKSLYDLHHGVGKRAKNKKIWGEVTRENIAQYVTEVKKIRFEAHKDFILNYRKDNQTEEEIDILLQKANEDFIIEYDKDAGIIIFDKLPYDLASYYSEKDPVKKRYYLCHCPWARFAIEENNTLPGDICDCSVGFTQRSFLGDIEGEMKYEIVETVLRGDERCRFIFHLPEELK